MDNGALIRKRGTIAGLAVGRELAAAGACCLLLAIAAHVRVPVPGSDVPMTLQLLGVLIIGLVAGPTRAFAGTSFYLICGAVGLPVFAPGSCGLLGPTGGYLVGFVAAAWVVARLKERCAGSIRLMTAACAAGAGLVLVLGVVWRAALLGQGFIPSVRTGLAPFLIKAAVEVLLAVTFAVIIGRLRHEPVAGQAGSQIRRN